ncbi:energy transducer TonB [Hymenobacter sp. H14-R3]|uniref:energy transducer TonB n=1 Tax=Hymenobacter sp. H14-R3 TaxID=3046308 RepID=UPI0024BA60F3|nr:energy transducer TonB [Hymenobacter sp. H14-R3]MDJ0363702.1 energy transducer TonB [Hymenobacter sp. H14-R3]
MFNPRFLPLLLALAAATPALAQKPAKLKYPGNDSKQVYDAVEQPAVPKGGPAAYADYLQSHQKYPTAALRANQEGTVLVNFIVEKSGSVGEVEVKQPVAPLLDAEAIRVIKSGPKWTPARQRGQLVRQRVTVPVSFVLAPGSGETVEVPAPGSGKAAAPLPPGAVAAAPGTTSVVGTAPNGAGIIRPEKSAQPVGGNAAFFTWITANQKYPDLARKRHIQAKVPVEFTVQPDGSLTDARVIQKHGSGLDEEALRLIKTAPKWEPALYQGKPIKQKMTLPVIFQL